MTDKMNPQIKEAWVAALRSGKYKQGTGSLSAYMTRRKATRTAVLVYCAMSLILMGGTTQK